MVGVGVQCLELGDNYVKNKDDQDLESPRAHLTTKEKKEIKERN